MNEQLRIIPLCLLALICTQIPTVIPVKASPQTQTNAANPTAPEAIARQITVRVLVGDRRSSGTIIARRGNRYTILTNAHVTNKGNTYRITAPDGKTYPAKCAQPLKQGVCTADKNHDLALLEFTSSQTYTVPAWGDSLSLIPGETIYSAGFPFEAKDLKTSKGKVDIQTNKPLMGGYQIGFNITTEPGMSGGSLLNAKGKLIGILGFSSYPILNDGYQYQDRSQPAASEIARWRKSSFAIRVVTLAKIDRQYEALLPKDSDRNIIARSYPVIKRVDDIARQITVRIDDKDGDHGSGVIFARVGNTYSVLTAAHVVQEIKTEGRRNVLREKKANLLVTPTKEAITLKEGDYSVIDKNLDMAVVTFQSTQNYRVAKIGNYQLQDGNWIFLSGFADPNFTELSIGKVSKSDRSAKEFYTKDNRSLSNGHDLLYTNLSKHGMSGGAVLDLEGNLVGINNGVEDESFLSNNGYSEVNFGYAFGVPISTFLKKVGPQQKNINQIAPSALTSQEDTTILAYQFALMIASDYLIFECDTAKRCLGSGNLYWRAGLNDMAVKDFDRAIRLLEKSNNSERDLLKIAYYGKGLALSEDNKHKIAVAAFHRVTELDRKFFPAWRSLGQSLDNIGRKTDAVNAYTMAISLNSSHILYIVRGDVLRQLKRYSEAIDSGNQAVQLQPDDLLGYMLQGMIHEEQKKYDLALAQYNKASKIDPQSVSAYSHMGDIYTNQKKYDLALKQYNKATKIDHLSIEGYLGQGNIYLLQKKYDLALVQFDKITKIAPQFVYAYNNRGVIYFLQKKYELALVQFDKATKIAPQLGDAYNNRGFTYYEIGNLNEAMQNWRRAISIDSVNVESTLALAVALFKQGKQTEAYNMAEKAIELNRDFANIQYLKDSLWSDKIVADTQQLLSTSRMKAFIFQNGR
jgi:tetratricopeptide (TPR) repeat protein